MLLTGVLIHFGKGSVLQAFIAVIFSFGFFALHVRFWPCKHNADNMLRLTTELQIFITCVTALALKSDIADETKLDYMLITFLILNIPMAFFTCLWVKRQTWKRVFSNELATNPASLDKYAYAVLLYQLGVTSKELTNDLKTFVEQKRDEYKKLQADKNFAWVRDHLKMFVCRGEKMTDVDTWTAIDCRRNYEDEKKKRNSSERMSLKIELEPEPEPEAVSGQSDMETLAEQILKDIKHQTDTKDVFLSHSQESGQTDVASLNEELKRNNIQTWFDKDQSKTTVYEMWKGVVECKNFLLYLSKEALLRPFVRQEILWAQQYEKNIILLWKKEGKGSVPSFGDFTRDLQQNYNDGNELLVRLDENLLNSNQAIEFHPEGVPKSLQHVLHEVSFRLLLKRCKGLNEVASLPQQEEEHAMKWWLPSDSFWHRTPRPVLRTFCAVDASQQVLTIIKQLEGKCPGLKMHRWNHGGVHNVPPRVPPLSVALVYITDGLIMDEKKLTEINEMLYGCAATEHRDLTGTWRPVVWVVETDRRHAPTEAHDSMEKKYYLENGKKISLKKRREWSWRQTGTAFFSEIF
jgi:hypothetical protein